MWQRTTWLFLTVEEMLVCHLNSLNYHLVLCYSTSLESSFSWKQPILCPKDLTQSWKARSVQPMHQESLTLLLEWFSWHSTFFCHSPQYLNSVSEMPLINFTGIYSSYNLAAARIKLLLSLWGHSCCFSLNYYFISGFQILLYKVIGVL